MNNTLFQYAQDAFDKGDLAAALNSYTQCLRDEDEPVEPGEIGLLYHRIGNCLMKLRDYDEAIHAYTQATADASYEEIGAVNCNLGTAYAALRDYEDAIKHFEIAVSDRRYPTTYKAYSGMGKAYLKLGKTAEAGSSFRSAALDEANPNPAQALLNLGICFLALDRPDDAVQSYESALSFDMSAETKNKLYANLGQAYTACGKMQEAVNAFDMAIADKTYFLNDAANVDYQRAVGAVAQGTAVMEPIGSGTGTSLAQAAEAEMEGADTSGLDVTADGTPVYNETDEDAAAQHPLNMADNYAIDDNYASSDDRFFNASDDELEQWSRVVAKEDRKRRNVGLKVLLTILIIALILFALGVFGYTQGLGYPTQESVAKSLFADKANAAALFSENVAQDAIPSMLDPVIEDGDVVIDGVERSMNSTVVYTTAQTPDGGQVHYKLTMERSGISWKVSNVELYFPSQN